MRRQQRPPTGQALGVRLWGSHATVSHATALADFAGVKVECTGKLSEVPAELHGRRRQNRHQCDTEREVERRTPATWLQLSVTGRSGHTSLSITDLSNPSEAPAMVTGPSLGDLRRLAGRRLPDYGRDGSVPDAPERLHGGHGGWHGHRVAAPPRALELGITHACRRWAGATTS